MARLRVITNCQVLTEGWDEPKVNCIIHAAPTKSQSPLHAEDRKRNSAISRYWKGRLPRH